MIRTSRPAVDRRILSALCMTKDGQPLSYNRAPAADLADWLARLSVTITRLEPGQTLSCSRFSDTAGIGIQLESDYVSGLADGFQHHGTGALFFGPQSRVLPVHLHKSFVSIAVMFRPSACSALIGCGMQQFVDRARPTRYWSPEYLVSLFDPDGTPEQWLLIVEDLFRQRIARQDHPPPNPIVARFEEIAFRTPAIAIAEAAHEIGVDRRRLERLVVRDFGLPPKQVLKRARALDMASHLRGVADGEEAETLALRYYDESHLIREFVELFGMSPRQFASLPQPLLTLNLEIRQARRLEMMQRLQPGARRPWE
jgi:AraC-like DNA-binding protein